MKGKSKEIVLEPQELMEIGSKTDKVLQGKPKGRKFKNPLHELLEAAITADGSFQS